MFWILFWIGLVVFVINYVLINPFKYWKKRNIPQASIWFYWKNIIAALTARNAPVEMIQELYNSIPNQRYAGIYQFHVPTFLIRDPELIKQITVKDFDHFVDHNQIVRDEPLWERNLIGLKGNKWKQMRTTLTPSFTSSKMKMMFGLMCDCAEQFIDHYQKKNEKLITLEMKQTISMYTNDVIASIAFGIKINSLEDPENEFYLKGTKALNFGGLGALLIYLFPRLGKLLGLKMFSPDITNFFTKLIKDNIELREREGIVRMDMIHLLMQARKGALKDEATNLEMSAEEAENYRKLTLVDITAQALIFFFAGFESVSAGMCFALYELAIHPEIQERLQKEVDDTLSDCGGKITYEALMKMKYLDMVISESTRKWPTAWVTDRLCVKPYIIEPVLPEEKPIHIKEGDVLAIPIHAIQHDQRFYPEPDRFDPERFNEENKSKINPYTYLSFGIGPRSCIGNRFALLEMKTAIFYILSKFNVVVVDETPIPLKLSNNPVNLGAKDGFWLGLRSRTL